jgi:excisionase family DNA binding protein
VGLDTPVFDKSAKSDIESLHVEIGRQDKYFCEYISGCLMTTKSISTSQKFLRTSEVADLLLVSNRTVQRWADKNIIKAKVLPSGHRRFDEKEINKMKRGQ